ncbi:DUF397 domain-containing protein [Streptomyces sp. RKAG293]|uniref:DUF397 domain-containing protein n=1 Tax=Streptomyces sp. RKAG293 TaxID=2893403 RepID=UPI002033E005|nr:DUF397 domain-containing protein [Streptomyces sp. RKAG293]MCM2419797.1 DUF397 domain-containing protein [Streptomyces sp. RKAG293]
MSALKWQKSSFCPESANCVHISRTSDGTVRLRESDDPDVTVRTTPAALRAFLHGVRAGALDHLAGGPGGAPGM